MWASRATSPVRQRAVRDAVRRRTFEHPHDAVLVVLTGAGVALGALLLVLVLVRV